MGGVKDSFKGGVRVSTWVMGAKLRAGLRAGFMFVAFLLLGKTS